MPSEFLKDNGRVGVSTRIPSNRCSICSSELPSSGLFCQYCDPPLPPEPLPESILGFGHTSLQILIAIILFSGGILYKMGIPFNQIWKIKPPSEGITPIEERPSDPDLEVTHLVNVNMANVREMPTLKGRIVVVLSKNEEVTIIERRQKWSQITAHGQTGWIGNRLLDSKVQ